MSEQITLPLILKSHQEDGFFYGYASVFDVVDLHRDSIAKGAFHKCLQKRLPKMLWQHDITKPIGIWHEVYETEQGLFVKGQLLLDIQAGQEAYALLKSGVVDSLSIGFRLVRARKDTKTNARVLDEVDLQEISLVTFAANQQAKVITVKDALLNEGLPMTPEFLNIDTSELAKVSQQIEKAEQRLSQLEVALKRPQLTQETPSSDFACFVRKGLEETKALHSGSESTGGYLIPAAAIEMIHQRLGELSLMRKLSRVTTINTNALELLVEKGDADVGWVAETAERPETATPELAKLHIAVHQLYAKPRVSQKLLDDSMIDAENWLAEKIAEKFAKVENISFLHGNGEGKPRGLLTYEPTELGKPTWGKIEVVKTGLDNNIDTIDVLVDAYYAMKTEYISGSSWLMPRTIAAKIRKMRDKATNTLLWQQSLTAGEPDKLLGHPVHLCDDMLPLSPKMPAMLAFGNFKAAYQIVDRHMMHVLRDPYSAKPYVEFYTTKRVGGDVVNFEAFKLIALSE